MWQATALLGRYHSLPQAGGAGGGGQGPQGGWQGQGAPEKMMLDKKLVLEIVKVLEGSTLLPD